MTNKGSIFGSIYFSNELMIFKDKTDKDTREDNENKKTTDNKECLNKMFCGEENFGKIKKRFIAG